MRQLLSHQVGIAEADPVLSLEELLSHPAAANQLAETIPFWRPGSAFGYHGITIGNLADELIFRITGRTVQDFYEQELRQPIGADFFLGLPEVHDQRVARVLPMVPPLAEFPAQEFFPLRAKVLGLRPGARVDLANDPTSWRFGHLAVSSTASAKGIATLFAAAVTGIDGHPPIMSARTVAIIGQQQVRGYDEVLGQADRAHAIVFQKASAVGVGWAAQLRSRRCRRGDRLRRSRHRDRVRVHVCSWPVARWC